MDCCCRRGNRVTLFQPNTDPADPLSPLESTALRDPADPEPAEGWSTDIYFYFCPVLSHLGLVTLVSLCIWTKEQISRLLLQQQLVWRTARQVCDSITETQWDPHINVEGYIEWQEYMQPYLCTSSQHLRPRSYISSVNSTSSILDWSTGPIIFTESLTTVTNPITEDKAVWTYINWRNTLGRFFHNPQMHKILNRLYQSASLWSLFEVQRNI